MSSQDLFLDDGNFTFTDRFCVCTASFVFPCAISDVESDSSVISIPQPIRESPSPELIDITTQDPEADQSADGMPRFDNNNKSREQIAIIAQLQ